MRTYVLQGFTQRDSSLNGDTRSRRMAVDRIVSTSAAMLASRDRTWMHILANSRAGLRHLEEMWAPGRPSGKADARARSSSEWRGPCATSITSSTMPRSRRR